MTASPQPPTVAEEHDSESLRGFNEIADLVLVVDCAVSSEGERKVARCLCANTSARSFLEARSPGEAGAMDVSELFPAHRVRKLHREVQHCGACIDRRWVLDSPRGEVTALTGGGGGGRETDPVTLDCSFRPILFRDGGEEARQMVMS